MRPQISRKLIATVTRILCFGMGVISLISGLALLLMVVVPVFADRDEGTTLLIPMLVLGFSVFDISVGLLLLLRGKSFSRFCEAKFVQILSNKTVNDRPLTDPN